MGLAHETRRSARHGKGDHMTPYQLGVKVAAEHSTIYSGLQPPTGNPAWDSPDTHRVRPGQYTSPKDKRSRHITYKPRPVRFLAGQLTWPDQAAYITPFKPGVGSGPDQAKIQGVAYGRDIRGPSPVPVATELDDQLTGIPGAWPEHRYELRKGEDPEVAKLTETPSDPSANRYASATDVDWWMNEARPKYLAGNEADNKVETIQYGNERHGRPVNEGLPALKPAAKPSVQPATKSVVQPVKQPEAETMNKGGAYQLGIKCADDASLMRAADAMHQTREMYRKQPWWSPGNIPGGFLAAGDALGRAAGL